MGGRKRVLFVSDTPLASTGYARIVRELLPRLQASHDVALVSCFGAYGDSRLRELPFKVYEAAYNPADPAAVAEYNQDPLAKLGRGTLERACLEFQCDVVASFRDMDVDEWILRSPLRRYFRVLLMPTCDARPQKEEWVAACRQTDGLLSYTEFGRDVLTSQMGGGGPPHFGPATPAVDYATYHPLPDREARRQAAGLGDAFVVGSVMRNNDRKLFPKLISSFARVARQVPRATLYLHTGYPDISGWDIPKLLLEAGVSSRTLFTYLCRSCGSTYPSHWAGAAAPCRACGKRTARTANSDQGVDDKTLAGVYALFDVYCHLAYAGGLELPILEAAACGVPVVTNDYASMGELGRKLGATLVPNTLDRQVDSHRLVASPAENDVVQALLELAELPPSVRRLAGYRQSVACRRTYSWDDCAARWAAAVSALPPPERDWRAGLADWAAPPQDPPEGLSDAEFARHCFHAVRGASPPGTLFELKAARDLASGDRSAAWAKAKAEAGVLTHWERERARRLYCPPPFSSLELTRSRPATASPPAAT